MNALLLFMNITMLVAGQVLFKMGLDRMGGVTLVTSWKALFIPHILVGLVLYALATLVWFVVLSRMSLSTAYPISSLAYVFGMIVALIVFNEPVSITKWIGAGIIIFGVILISK
ncbi:EamA family transporter [Paenibacillus sp. OSY-SE]|uniref:EamA family transporter n=1 Tax=Paenibacillus sp. OSY-SE TaxID=1196323 RepID=UPI0003823257|nr:EamA family transporter [Paenibacillus sp. OSY-SE]